MKQFLKYFSGRKYGAAEDVRVLAARIRIQGRRRLRLRLRTVHALQNCLRAAASMESGGDEALRRFKMDAGHIEACLRQAQAEGGMRLHAAGKTPRTLLLARALIAGGGKRPGLQELLDEISTFDSMQNMEMREILLLPAALNIALCEEFARLGEALMQCADVRRAAQKWVRRGGKGRTPGKNRDVFFEHALRLCAEMELSQLHSRLEGIIRKYGEETQGLVESCHRASAEKCMRLDNLMSMYRLLGALDWEECFKQLSQADMELCSDPANVYMNMDDASRSEIRTAVAELAAEARTEEIVVVRYALRLAQNAAENLGIQDPRATVCWYLAEDAGRELLFRELGKKRGPKPRVPDADGGKTVILSCAAAAAVLAVLLLGIGNPFLVPFLPPLAWVSAQQLIAHFYPRRVKPMRLMKMKVEKVPDSARTLVVLPVLLSSEQRVGEMIAHMEALGCLEGDTNIDYLLLGDFKDADRQNMPGDDAILAAARNSIARLNAEAEREKYFYLHRGRRLREKDGRWMGENRKRGALMAINALLLGRSGAEEVFDAEGRAARYLAERYAYVVTLDADTEYLPGTLQELIGTMLHPLNRACEMGGERRGYAVLQPNMQLLAEANVNAYVRLTAGSGGMDSYPVSVSDFYQDMTGRGCFAGKGIYDVRAFSRATEGVLRDDEILSHDLIEGILSGAGYVNDVHFFDGCPDNLSGELVRQHRWTRGDWQLLPVLFSRLKMTAVDRLKLLGNLLRSLYAPALSALLILAVWLDAPTAFSLGLLLAFQEPLLQLKGGRRLWKRALLQLALLPADALCRLDAIVRTLWRLGISHRHLMDWVPAADAGGSGKWTHFPGRLAALLLLPGLLRPFWIPAVLAMAALFFIGEDWADDLARAKSGGNDVLSDEQKALLEDIARRTWHFFEDCVPEDGCGLPPDNVQLDPPVGAARRTSPTNIGLYMMSCFAAQELGFLRGDTMLSRMRRTVETMENLDKWNGQLYNWYDLNNLQPLKPRYVSAVDSGNLAAALLLCAAVVKDLDVQLSARMAELARNMNLAALYDEKRDLFRIGLDGENGRLSESHYDLYASEARILSYAAMMLGQVPLRHWKHLSRAEVRAGKYQALISWSGTLFEYLMPELMLRSCTDTLAANSRRGAVRCQMDYGRALNRPWGVSESGYYAFDLHLNYQYRAFGLRALALSGNAVQDVAAPYAAALALSEAPREAADNLKRMCELGWSGEYGLYEAADYLHLDAGRRPRLVRSHMAHHQGMALCALCNALREDVISRRFMEIPQARALRMLLQEKGGARIRLRRRKADLHPRWVQDKPRAEYLRYGRKDNWAIDAHLLHGGKTTALATARGGIFVWSEGLQLNRFAGDLQSCHEGMYVHLRDCETGKEVVVGREGKAQFDAGSVCYLEEFEGLKLKLRLCISPEDGTLYQRLEIRNTNEEVRRVEITGCLAVALAPERDMRAHPVFQNLFVTSRIQNENALVFTRRRRDAGEALPEMIYLVSGSSAPEYETSLERLAGRTGSLGMPGGIARKLSNAAGNSLNPCAALRREMEIAAGETASLHFALALSGADEVPQRIERMRTREAAERASQLAFTHALAVLSHAGIDARQYRLLQRSSILLFDARLRPWVLRGENACSDVPKAALWRAGISGDVPILLVEVGENGNMDCVRSAVRMHAFYRTMGITLDFVLLNHQESDYHRTQQNALNDLLASSHLNGYFGESGGAHLLEVQNLDDESCMAIRRAAALCFSANEDSEIQLRAMLDALPLGEHARYAPMKAGQVDFPQNAAFFNGFGGFDGGSYAIFLRDGVLPPAPWSNVLASEQAGAIVTERGGGFAWHGNSRTSRLTPFANDALREGWGWMFYLLDEAERTWIRLLPGDVPMTQFCVRHEPGRSRWNGCADGIAFSLEMRAERQGVHFEIRLRNEGRGSRHLRLAGFVDWLMSGDSTDAALLRTWSRFGGCFASGVAEGIGCFLADDPRARPGCDRQVLFSSGDIMQPEGFDFLDCSSGGWTLQLPVSLRPGEVRCCRFLLGRAGDIAEAYALARDFRSGEALRRSGENWRERLDKLKIETPDAGVNLLANGFLQAQILNARIRGRTGLYQPGGAYGFRDQLQDMLPMIYYEPERVRRHLLHCAARQFEAGDVLHWWHEPYHGVRTKISDDLLFLPYVAARYVYITGDENVLQECVPFLQDVEIPEGREDIYAEMRPTSHCASLHEHCMRAFRHAARTGEHGLCLMGSGDWNDGMNRVGEKGRGESVWLSEFLAVCAEEYARISPDGEDASWLAALSERMRSAVEEQGWDGAWYLRAYTDEGERLGGRQSPCCRIDAISQAWAVLAGLDEQRCASAMDQAWGQLVDEELGIIRLLAPPFNGKGIDPGYIAAYPQGVRENGAQYTHAACWLMYALAVQGDEERAHRALGLLMPMNHAKSCRDAERYRVEPYVMAADVYSEGEYAGRGGWTWYTGSAAWMLLSILKLLGFERRKNRVRMQPLMGEWKEVSIELQYGLSKYRLVCRTDVSQPQLDGVPLENGYVNLFDDGREHIALFPPKKKCSI